MKDIIDQNVNILKRQRNLSYLDDDFGILSDMVKLYLIIISFNFF